MIANRLFVFGCSLLTAAKAFALIGPSRAVPLRNMHMTLEISEFPGQLNNVGFFDPLKLSAGAPEKVLKRWQVKLSLSHSNF